MEIRDSALNDADEFKWHIVTDKYEYRQLCLLVWWHTQNIYFHIWKELWSIFLYCGYWNISNKSKEKKQRCHRHSLSETCKSKHLLLTDIEDGSVSSCASFWKTAVVRSLVLTVEHWRKIWLFNKLCNTYSI